MRPQFLFAAGAFPLVVVVSSSHAGIANPWADSVVSYTQGTGAAPGYTDASTVLGSPERFTGEGIFPGAVTPMNSPWGVDEIVSIGEGGQLTVVFDEPVTNDAANPFGLDLLIFGNAFFTDFNGPFRIESEPGVIEVSTDGFVWHEVTGVFADDLYPTLGYRDLDTFFDTEPGSVLTDFTLPVDPSLTVDDFAGLSISQLDALYNGSGGGTGVDIGALGLSEISFVRISNPVGSGISPEIDAFADVAAVPGPATFALFLVGALVGRRRRDGGMR